MKPLLVYLFIINAAALYLMLTDKHRAKNKLHRIPELALFTTALAGGSLGCFLGMQLFRHKTRKASFSVGIPVILVVHLILFSSLFPP